MKELLYLLSYIDISSKFTTFKAGCEQRYLRLIITSWNIVEEIGIEPNTVKYDYLSRIS